MEHSYRLTLASLLIMSVPLMSVVVGATTPSHHEIRLDTNQLRMEIEASKKQSALELELSTQVLRQQVEAYIRAETERFENYRAIQIEMSKNLKEMLKREMI